MAILSKEWFYENISENDRCGIFHIWDTSCWKASSSSNFLLDIAKGTAKFFLPIYLLKLLINYKKIKDINFIKSLLMAEATSIVYGVTMGFLLISTVCVLRKLCGRMHYYNIMFFPGIVSGLSLLVESRENQILDTLIFFNSFVEATIRIIHHTVFRITKLREILMFMAVSGSLMYFMENRSKKLNMIYFWFYTPPRRKNDEVNKICNHDHNCWQFSKEGFAKYFSLGYIISVIRTLLPRMGVLIKKPNKSLNMLFNRSNVKFGLFLGSYVAIYRTLTCHLLKWGKIRTKFHGLIAGILSGLTYGISPNIQVLSVGITTLLQILYADISEKLSIKNHFWPRQILYMVCHGTLMHLKFCYPKLCPEYYKNMIDACTNNVTVQVYESILSQYFPEEFGKKHVKYLTGI